MSRRVPPVWPAAVASVGIHIAVFGAGQRLDLHSEQQPAAPRIAAVELVTLPEPEPEPEPAPEPAPEPEPEPEPEPTLDPEPAATPARVPAKLPDDAPAEPEATPPTAPPPTPLGDPEGETTPTAPTVETVGGKAPVAAQEGRGPAPAAAEARAKGNPAGPRGMSQAELRSYASGCRGRFLRHRRYPPAALELGLEGRVKVKLTVDRLGQLVGEPTVMASSGHSVLDREALRAVAAAAPFAPLPAHADRDALVLVIPIDFRIDEGARR